MLFELGGKRKRVVQVVFALLAAMFAITFVGLGVGSSASGGLFDAIGIGGNSTSTDANPAYDRQIDRAEETLATTPDDEQALLTLARTHFLKAQDALERNDRNEPVAFTDESLSEYREAIDAWETYLATKPQKPDDGVAPLIGQAYGYLASEATSTEELQSSLDGTLETARIVAEARPSVGSLTQLAAAAYLAGDTKTADQASKDALAEATDPDLRKQVKSQLTSAKAQGKQVRASIEQGALQEKQAEKANAPDESQLENPLGGFGGTPAPATPLPGAAPGGTAPLPGGTPPPTP